MNVKFEISDNQKKMMKAIIRKEKLTLTIEGNHLSVDQKSFTEKTAESIVRGLKGLYARRVKEVAEGKAPAKSINGRSGSANNLLARFNKNGLTVSGYIGTKKADETDFTY